MAVSGSLARRTKSGVPPVRFAQYTLSRSALDVHSAAVVAVIDAALLDDMSELKLLEAGIQAAHLHGAGSIDSRAIAAAFYERRVARNGWADKCQTRDYIQYLFRGVAGVAKKCVAGSYALDMSATAAFPQRTPAALPSTSTPSSTPSSSQTKPAKPAKPARTAKPVAKPVANPKAVLRPVSPDSLGRVDLTTRTPDEMVVDGHAAQVALDAAKDRHELVRAAAVTGAFICQLPAFESDLADVAIKLPNDTWMFIEAKSVTVKNYTSQIEKGIGQLLRQKTRYHLSDRDRLFIALDCIPAGISPETVDEMALTAISVGIEVVFWKTEDGHSRFAEAVSEY